MKLISVNAHPIMDQEAQALVFFTTEKDGKVSGYPSSIEDRFPALSGMIAQQEYKSGILQNLLVPGSVNNSLQYLLLVGLGKEHSSNKIDIETLRRACGKVVRSAEAHKLSSLAIALPDNNLFGADANYMAREMSIALEMANYHFDTFISDKSKKHTIESITLVASENNLETTNSGAQDGEIIAQGVNRARSWVDAPPSDLTPPQLATYAQEIAEKNGLKITVFDEEQVNEMGMGGLAGVSRGSEKDCRFVAMEYLVGKDRPTLCFVGKGITFDSGGLSLKPAQYMETMKEDMSGAAAVIASMDVIAKLKPNVNVIGITALSENLPGGQATKPGDILRFYNGKTAEVKNTDAEGRLVLADALSYAEKHYDIDAMIDLATLTGACAYALGPFFSGLMSTHDEFVENIQHASKRSGDAVWRLPFTDDYKKAIESPVSDVSNIGSRRYQSGAITAGHFLGNFVEKTPWAHLDIAGTAFDVPDLPYYRNDSATGVGVRLLTELALNWAKK